MRNADFLKLVKDTHQRMLGLSATKGVEYARNDDDQLANFKRLAEENGTTPEAICNVYLTKHLDAIKYRVKCIGLGKKFMESEPITGRIDDAILFLILMKALMIERNASENPL